MFLQCLNFCPSLPGTEIPFFVFFCLLWPQVAQGLFEGICAHGIRRGRPMNAALPPGRIVVLRPPTDLYKRGLISAGFV